MLAAGLDVARINFSHGSPDEHQRRIGRLREAARAAGRVVAVLGDLPGPKLRAQLAAPLPLAPGAEIALVATAEAAPAVQVSEPDVLRQVRPNQRILLDDGRLELRVVRVTPGRVLARVVVGGTLLPNKGINFPDTPLSIPGLTPRDREALGVAAAAGVDWLALSFVRGPAAAAEVGEAARSRGLYVPVLAKIERPEAVEQAEAILEVFDGIMVARGDLGVEIPLERVPQVQKRLIAQTRSAGKPAITATDMLDSMRTNPRPTRAEVSDVANAIADGTSAVMLSGETAVGDYPVEAVTAMDRIARETERALLSEGPWDVAVPRGQIDDNITHSTCALAREIHADAIVTPTNSGRTARLVARHRPAAAIVAPAPDEAVQRRLALVWGVLPVPLPPDLPPGSDRLDAAVRAAFAHGALQAGQVAVVLAGHPVAGGDRSPTIRVVRVGEDGRSLEP
jgi:pyruvate kinase